MRLPLVYAVEQLDDQLMMETLTDLVFLQSNHGAFSSLSNFSVAFPILFRRTVVPQDAVLQSINYLQSQSQFDDDDDNKNKIKSISTNALKVTAHQLFGASSGGGGGSSSGIFSPPSHARDVPIKTTGWSCLEIANVVMGDDPTPTSRKTVVVVGAVFSGDVQFGHVLVARLSNGSMVRRTS